MLIFVYYFDIGFSRREHLDLYSTTVLLLSGENKENYQLALLNFPEERRSNYLLLMIYFLFCMQCLLLKPLFFCSMSRQIRAVGRKHLSELINCVDFREALSVKSVRTTT
jgi:hypothetical protein